MEFNWEDFRNKKIAVHCQTEIEDIDFREKCDEQGITWADGTIASERTCFNDLKNKTCYSYWKNSYLNENGIAYESWKHYRDKHYQFCEWSDYMEIQWESIPINLNNNKINVVLDEGAYMPEKAHDTDAGFDLRTPYNIVVPATKIQNDKIKIGMATVDTGIHIELPEETVGMIKSKSGLNFKHSITSEGVVDVGYEGSIKVKLYNFSDKDYCFLKGDKITQLVILPIVDKELTLVDKLAETERGDNGFGSTGK